MFLDLAGISDQPFESIKQDELPTTLSIPSQSQSSPVIHFANVNLEQPFLSSIYSL